MLSGFSVAASNWYCTCTNALHFTHTQDENHQKELDSYADIADGASGIVDRCHYTGFLVKDTRGEAVADGWSVVVQGSVFWSC